MRNLFALAGQVSRQRLSLRTIAWVLSVGLLTLLQLAVVEPAAHAQVPGAPTSLTATGATSSIALSWTAPSGTVTSYNVYRGTSSGGESATPIETGVSTTAFTDTSTTGLINGYTYYYEVAAVNGSGTGPDSNEASAEAGSSTIAAPTSVEDYVGDSHAIVYWPTVTGATSYKMYRSTGGSYSLLAEGIDNTFPGVGHAYIGYADGSAVNGTAYSYKVSSVNSSGEGPLGSAISATPTDSSLPAAPQFPAATAGSDSVSLKVNTPANYAYRATSSGGEGLLPSVLLDDPGPGNISGGDSSLTDGTTYYYVLTQVASVGGQNVESERSTEISATPGSTLLSAPTLTVNTTGNMGPLLSWTSVTGAASYNISQTNTSHDITVIANVPTGTNSYFDASEQYGDSDDYTVAAVETAGQGTLSTSVSGMLQGFGIQASPTTLTIAPGSGGAITILTPACQNPHGSPTSFTGSVAITVSGAPSGVTSWFLPSAPVTIANWGDNAGEDNYSAGTNLFLSVASTTSPGTYTLTITGTSQAGASESFTQTQAITLIVS